LAWRLARDPAVREVVCTPGNAGIAGDVRVESIPATDLLGLRAFAMSSRIDLTVVGPELPLDGGIVDLFAAEGLRILGPSRAAARLESSKVFAKAFMARHGIPTARYRACDSSKAALDVVRSGELGLPLVVKADGLAAGKGVVVAADREAAAAAIHAAMDEGQFGDAGTRVVLEECLTGPEVSFFALCDGHRALPIGTAQDHKRVFDGDRGPNTGGMGAFAPSPLVDEPLQTRMLSEIVMPVLAGMRAEGHPYRGFLYAGLMLTSGGPKVIEFNVRLGDPEAQVIVPMLDDGVAGRLAEAADGALSREPIGCSSEPHVGVVLASEGYPGTVVTGRSITGLDAAAGLEAVHVFHAGTETRDGELVTAGGRVLTIVGHGSSYRDAIARAYDGVSHISFAGMHYRRDIGRKALAAAPAR
jgi:phosphoribosylamine--glycine ligase